MFRYDIFTPTPTVVDAYGVDSPGFLSLTNAVQPVQLFLSNFCRRDCSSAGICGLLEEGSPRHQCTCLIGTLGCKSCAVECLLASTTGTGPSMACPARHPCATATATTTAGFSGVACEHCSKYFWGPGCEPCPGAGSKTDPTKPLSLGNVCSMRGTCDDGKSGGGKCTCGEPFSGPDCSIGDCGAGDEQVVDEQSGLYVCRQCPPGRFKATISAAPCAKCAAGSFCPQGAKSEEQCAAGFFCPTTDSQFPCTGAGSFCLSGSTIEARCAVGHFCESATSQVKCDAGMFCEEGSNKQTKCPAGFYCPDGGTKVECAEGMQCPTGSSRTTPCKAGEHNPLDKVELGEPCKPCEAGKNQPEEGMPQCQDCLPGEYCPAGSAEAEDCAIGTFKDPASTADVPSQPCEQCAAGKWQALPKQGSCDDCGAGEYCSGTAAPDVCAVGHFSPNPTMPCQPCAAGTWQTVARKAACDPCVAGEYCSGSAAPEDCEEGYASTDPKVPCVACEPGRFQGSSGKQTCTECAEGKFQDMAGLFRRRGGFGGEAGSDNWPAAVAAVVCGLADTQRHSIPALGQDSCKDCEVCGGGYQPMGDSECTKTSNRKCEKCLPGLVNSGVPEPNTKCTKCEKGKFHDGTTPALQCEPCRLCGPVVSAP